MKSALPSITSFSGNYRFLSNFWPCTLRASNGIVYPSSEHAYQAAKFLSLERRLAIASLATPAEAKKVGQSGYLRPNWDLIKDKVMYKIVHAKFRQNPDLAKLLLATGDALLIEGNTWGDTYWGVCNGVGRNKLGKLLMKIREEIKP